MSVYYIVGTAQEAGNKAANKQVPASGVTAILPPAWASRHLCLMLGSSGITHSVHAAPWPWSPRTLSRKLFARQLGTDLALPSVR